MVTWSALVLKLSKLEATKTKVTYKVRAELKKIKNMNSNSTWWRFWSHCVNLKLQKHPALLIKGLPKLDAKQFLLKLSQNKEGWIFVCHKRQNDVFFSDASCKKKHHFAEHDKQIFSPSYFVIALKIKKKLFHKPKDIFTMLLSAWARVLVIWYMGKTLAVL